MKDVKANAWAARGQTICTIDIEGRQVVRFAIDAIITTDKLKLYLHSLGRAIADGLEEAGERSGLENELRAMLNAH